MLNRSLSMWGAPRGRVAAASSIPGGTWSDTFDATDSLADRRSLAGTGPFTWAADDTLCVDLAVIHARATGGGAYASVTALKQRADGVQAWYDNAQFVCNTIANVVGVEETRTDAWRAYPIPTEGLDHLQGPSTGSDPTCVDCPTAHGESLLYAEQQESTDGFTIRMLDVVIGGRRTLFE